MATSCIGLVAPNMTETDTVSMARPAFKAAIRDSSSARASSELSQEDQEKSLYFDDISKVDSSRIEIKLSDAEEDILKSFQVVT